jgi:arylsulfatase A-like enzyme
VTDLLGVEPPTEWDGKTLTSSVFEGEAPADEPVVSVTVRGEEVTTQPIPRSLDDGDLLVSVRDGEWTYIENIDQGTEELYYRPDDPTEGTDRSEEDGAEEQRVLDQFGSIAESHARVLKSRVGEESDRDVDEDLEHRLEALGYR